MPTRNQLRSLEAKELANSRALQDSVGRVAYLWPSATGLRKGILDATQQVRGLLARGQLHDYGLQGRGAREHGVEIPAVLVGDRWLTRTRASLYRPKAKPATPGDPRLWVTGLPGFAEAGDLVALFVHDGILHLLNLSRSTLHEDLNSGRTTAATELAKSARAESSVVAVELLTRLRAVANKGPIRSVIGGDLAIGWTIEAALGIPPNVDKTPDYKGIELKSTRSRRPGLTTLFAQEPDWSISKLKSQDEVIEAFGYWRNDRSNLKCNVSGDEYNSQGLKLRVDLAPDELVEESADPSMGDVLKWKLPVLRGRMAEKHRETFWIDATSTMRAGVEYFELKAVEHTRGPYVDQLGLLLQIGTVVVNHRLHRYPGKATRSHGTAFRLAPGGLVMLFPQSESHSLG
jgi:hypothetical protein